MASLFVIFGGNKVDYYPLAKHTHVIGRDESVPIQVLDRQVSRKRIQIRFDKESECFYAIYMKSRNGVFINGINIYEETILADGDRIHIGDTEMLFTLKDFPGRQSALNNFKKVWERYFSTFFTNCTSFYRIQKSFFRKVSYRIRYKIIYKIKLLLHNNSLRRIYFLLFLAILSVCSKTFKNILLQFLNYHDQRYLNKSLSLNFPWFYLLKNNHNQNDIFILVVETVVVSR